MLAGRIAEAASVPSCVPVKGRPTGRPLSVRDLLVARSLEEKLPRDGSERGSRGRRGGVLA